MLENSYLNLNEVGLNGINAIWIAVYANQAAILQELYATSVDRDMPMNLNARNKEGINALHLAAYYDNVDIASYLTNPEIPFDHNSGTMSGYTPLMIAIVRHNKQVVDLMLQHPDVNPNLATSRGISPLWVATMRQDTALMKQLLEKGASPVIKGDKSRKAKPLFEEQGT